MEIAPEISSGVKYQVRLRLLEWGFSFSRNLFFPGNVGVKVGSISERVKYVLFYIKGKFGSLYKMLGKGIIVGVWGITSQFSYH
jgi:hypothetical protein